MNQEDYGDKDDDFDDVFTGLRNALFGVLCAVIVVCAGCTALHKLIS